MQYLELLPIVLAVISIFVSAKAYLKARRKTDKLRLILSIVTAMIMIIAQTSWYTTSILLHRIEDSTFANYLWTIFNTLAMIILIMFPGPRIFKNDTQKSTDSGYKSN